MMKYDATQRWPDMQADWDKDWHKMSHLYFWHTRAHYKSIIPLLVGDVLDIGCGPGFLAAWTYPNEAHYTGIDISPEALTLAHTLFPAANFYQMDLSCQRAPISDGKFDTVVCAEVLEHLDTHTFILSEIKRLAKMHARIILTVPVKMTGVGHVWPEWTTEDLTACGKEVGQVLSIRVDYEENNMLAIVRRT